MLGAPWQASTIPLRPDGAGCPVATLVRRRQARGPGHAGAAPAVLYLHGFADYFFQAGHGRRWVEEGYDFYALDMRDHGRSIRPGRRPGWAAGIAAHVEEISAALRIIRADGGGTAGNDRPVVLLGHSTGGLIACLYADRRPGAVDALVLNSPWFDLHRPALMRALARPLIRMVGKVAPLLPVSTMDDGYGRSLHASTGGEFDYRLDWKPLDAFPVRAGWLASVLEAQRRVRHGLDILAPVLVCTSGASGHPTRPTTAQLAGTDVVLGVADMHRVAPALGTNVEVLQVPGGRHDLALSAEPARLAYAKQVLSWAAEKVGPTVR